MADDSDEDEQDEQDAVVICFGLSAEFGTHDDRDRVYALEDRLDAALGDLGGVDGHEFGDGTGIIYVYGADAGAMLAAMRSTLLEAELGDGAAAILQRMDDEGEHEVVKLA